MPDTHKSGPFRIVGRVIPVNGPDDPEHPVFIDIPLATFVIKSESFEYQDPSHGYVKHSILTDSKIHIDMDPSSGAAYIIHQGSPPVGYFPEAAPPTFDF